MHTGVRAAHRTAWDCGARLGFSGGTSEKYFPPHSDGKFGNRQQPPSRLEGLRSPVPLGNPSFEGNSPVPWQVSVPPRGYQFWSEFRNRARKPSSTERERTTIIFNSRFARQEPWSFVERNGNLLWRGSVDSASYQRPEPESLSECPCR